MRYLVPSRKRTVREELSSIFHLWTSYVKCRSEQSFCGQSSLSLRWMRRSHSCSTRRKNCAHWRWQRRRSLPSSGEQQMNWKRGRPNSVGTGAAVIRGERQPQLEARALQRHATSPPTPSHRGDDQSPFFEVNGLEEAN